MSRLALISIIVGTIAALSRLPGLFAPDQFREHVAKFPRSVWWGRVLMGIGAVWVGLVMYNAAIDEWAWARPMIVIGIPVAYWLVIRFANQFLAIRGAAVLTLLIAKLMVDAADLSEEPLRLVVVVLAYIWVVAAVWMAIAPHHARDLINFFMANDTRCRTSCSIGVAIGALLIVLGVFVY